MPDREQFLKEANIAVLSTVDAAGRPHGAPVWYLYDNGVFTISTGRGSQKHRNIERNPEVSLVIDSRTVPYYALMISGRAEIGPPFSPDERLRLAVRYLGEEMGRRYIEMTHGEDSISLSIQPRKTIEFDGRAGRAR